MTRPGRHPSARSLLLLAVAVALAGCGSPGAGDPTGPDARPTASSEATEAAPAARAQRVGAPTPEGPSRIRLPDGTSMPVREAPTTGSGLLDVPPDVRAAGWWPGGSRLGDPFGSTLIAAHVDSTTQGLGPFASLLEARAGDRVRLRSRGLEQVFAVTSLQVVPRRSFAERPRLRSPDGSRRLVLVTCAPPYVAARGGYQNLAVVIGEPVSDPSDRRAR